MKEVLHTGQVFCLKNLEACANSLTIRVSVDYLNGSPSRNADAKIDDLQSLQNEFEELMLIFDPNEKIFYIGIIKNTDNIERIVIKLENVFSSVRELGLEYDIQDSGAVSDKRAADNFRSFKYDKLILSPEGADMLVEMTNFSADTSEFFLEEDKDKLVKPQWRDPDNIAGDIKADLAMFAWYSRTSKVKKAVEGLTRLLKEVEACDGDTAVYDERLKEYEDILRECINDSRRDIRLYRDELLEDYNKK